MAAVSWGHRRCWKIVIILCTVTFVLWNYWLLGEPDGSELESSSAADQDIPKKTTIPIIPRTIATHNASSIIRATTHKPRVANSTSSYPRFEDTDKDIVVYGRIVAGYNYSVFSSTVHSVESLHYLFDLPLSALAWERVGFRSIVVLVIDRRKVISGEKVKYVLSTLFELKSVVVILNSHNNFAVMISQVSRLFLPYLINTACVDDLDLWEDTYLVTSDADLWPLNGNAFTLPNTTDILCLNAHCCGDFIHNSKSYSMVPIGSIGMKVKTWKSIARRRGFVPLSVDGIITYVKREFGIVATSHVEKGENLGWFLDQRLATVLIRDWAERQGNLSRVRYVRRDVGSDRIDRTAWRTYSLDGKTDTHILESGYEPRIWHRLESLLVLMYDKELFKWCKTYAETFLTLS